MKFNKELIIKELSLVPFGQKNWMRSKELSCPVCGKSDKFGVLITEKKSVIHCFYGCPPESLKSYLIKIGRKDLLQFEEDVDIREKLTSNLGELLEDLDLQMPEKSLPMGYKRIYDDDYLNQRGFKKEDYLKFEVGITKIDPRFKNEYIIFPLIDEQHRVVGYIARSRRTKKWHDENLKNTKEGKCKLVLRYDNSLDTDFSKYLYGENEINENTHTVIITEGILSKKAVDDKLELNNNDEIKCCATFGQNVSPYQIKKLKNKGIENIILLYDNGTIHSTKSISMNLTNYFNVKIGDIKKEGCDPDDLSQEELIEVMSNLKEPIDFYKGKISGKLKII